jgi:hypothetical protein
VLEIGVARVRVAGDDSVVATQTVRAGGRGTDDHEVTRGSWLGAGTMMDGMGDIEEAWRGAMARAEKVDRVMEGRKRTRRYINDGSL